MVPLPSKDRARSAQATSIHRASSNCWRRRVRPSNLSEPRPSTASRSRARRDAESAAELQKIEQEIKSGAIPPDLAQQALGEVKSLGNLTTNVYFDQSGLLRKQTVQVAGSTSGASGTVVMTFSAYGTPGTITTPAAADTVTLSQFLKDAMAFDSGLHA